jgi:hypothetical protein
MKKRIYFDKTVNINPYEISILIKNGKIREYHGFNLTNYFVASMIPNPNIQEGDLDYKTIELEEDFKLLKVGKYDKKKKGIKANYKIECSELFQLTLKDVYIKLNFIEKFLIDFDKKQTTFHEMKFKQKLIYYLIFSIPLLFIGYYLNNSGILTNKKPTIETPVESVEKNLKNEIYAIINNPKDGSSFKGSFDVKGIARNIPKNNHLWLVVCPRESIGCWPQYREIIPDNKGAWSGKVVIGGDDGKLLDIILVCANKEANNYFTDYIINQDKNNFPTRPMPEGAKSLTHITVLKASENNKTKDIENSIK